MTGPARTVAQMEADLRELIATVQDGHLRRLLDAVLGADASTWPAYREAPAAKRYHQAYRHGLLEHSLTVTQAISAMSGVFGGVNRDLAVTGGLLHDIGKLEAYTIDAEDHIEMSDVGRLHGEIPLGYFRIRSTIGALGDFPTELEHGLTHIILSHHGSLQHGSPVVPATREATLVHMADNLGSKFGSFDRVQAELGDGDLWSSYDRGIGTSAYFGLADLSTPPGVVDIAAGDPSAASGTRAAA
jgi:3'-5' exoribonuclease